MINDDDHDEDGEVRRDQFSDNTPGSRDEDETNSKDAWAHDKWRADPWMRDPWIERGLSEEEQAALDADEAKASSTPWEPTPEKPKDERDRNVAVEVNRLVWVSVVVAAALLAVVFLGSMLGIEFFQTLLPGLAIGCAVAIANLRLMSVGAVAMFHRNVVGALFGFGASFALLLGTAVLVLKLNPAWMLGYGLGIALPALSGVVFGIRLSRNNDDTN